MIAYKVTFYMLCTKSHSHLFYLSISRSQGQLQSGLDFKQYLTNPCASMCKQGLCQANNTANQDFWVYIYRIKHKI